MSDEASAKVVPLVRRREHAALRSILPLSFGGPQLKTGSSPRKSQEFRGGVV